MSHLECMIVTSTKDGPAAHRLGERGGTTRKVHPLATARGFPFDQCHEDRLGKQIPRRQIRNRDADADRPLPVGRRVRPSARSTAERSENAVPAGYSMP